MGLVVLSGMMDLTLGVRKIKLTYGTDYVGSFIVVYDLNGNPFKGPEHHSQLSLPYTAVVLLLLLIKKN